MMVMPHFQAMVSWKTVNWLMTVMYAGDYILPSIDVIQHKDESGHVGLTVLTLMPSSNFNLIGLKRVKVRHLLAFF
jgi:hypothetical protein